MDHPGGHRGPRARKKLYVGFANTFNLVRMKAPQWRREKCRVDSEIQGAGAPLSEHRPTPGGKVTLLACAVNQSSLGVDLHVLHHDPVAPNSRRASDDFPSLTTAFGASPRDGFSQTKLQRSCCSQPPRGVAEVSRSFPPRMPPAPVHH